MGFLSFLGTFFKRVAFAVGGFLLMVINGSAMIALTPRTGQPNIIVMIIGIVLFLVAVAMIAYAVKLKE